LDRILAPEQYFFDFRSGRPPRGAAAMMIGTFAEASGEGFVPAPSVPEAPKMGDK